MQDQDFAYLYEVENELWWFVGMRDITRTMLDPVCPPGVDRQILDAGSGTGGMMSWMKPYAGKGEITGIDLSSTALSFCQKQGHRRLVQASVTGLPFADASFDLVTSFDVLVQLPGHGSDQLGIREMMRVLKPGGTLFVRVAAYEWLKSDHDESLGTQHRYSRAEIVGKLEQAGLKVLRSTYANSFLLPLAMFIRLVLKPIGLSSGSDVKPLPAGLRWSNAPMTAALRTEATWLKGSKTKLGFGLSVICVARKR